MTEYKGIAGNEIPNPLTKQGSQTPFIGPELNLHPAALLEL